MFIIIAENAGNAVKNSAYKNRAYGKTVKILTRNIPPFII
jgi:hypothetical protein